jgi:hypothetical protein
VSGAGVRAELDAAVAVQRIAVGGGQSSAPRALETAISALPDLVAELELGEFLGALVVDAKPRLVLRFRRRPGSRIADLGDDVVLKVYGDQPRGEGPLLHLWHRRGVPTPRVRFGVAAGCSWIALEYLELTPVAPPHRADRLALTAELAVHAATMHRSAPGLAPVLRRLETVMLPRWDSAVTALEDAGYELPAEWRAAAAAAYEGGPRAPLHGDLGLPNIARGPDGRLVLYDASALTGRPVYDAARWAARLADDDVTPDELLTEWAKIESLAVDNADLELLAAECVLEAGSRLIVHGRSADQPPSSEVGMLIDVAARLLP